MLTPVAGSRRCFGGMVFDDPGRISLVDNVVMNPKPAMIMGIVYIYMYISYLYCNYNVDILYTYIQQTHSHHCQYMDIYIYHPHMFI